MARCAASGVRVWAVPACALALALSPAILIASSAHAQEAPPSATSIRAAWTQFVGAAVEGGDDDARYGGKVDVYGTVDGRDLGLWEGLSINVHPEFVYGRNVNASVPVLFPPNVAMTFPSSNEEDFDLSLYFVQKFGKASLTLGKINMLDIAAGTPLVGGGGLDGFQHTALAAPPSGITPATIFGGLLSVPVGRPTLTVGLWDPANRVNQTGFEDPFETGVAGMVSLAVAVPLDGKPGFHSFTVQATSKRGLNLADLEDVFLPPESEVVLGQRSGGFKLTYALQQYLWVDPSDSRRGWGVFGTAAVWQDNPLPFRWSATFGLTGSPPIAARPNDRFGIGYHRMTLSPALRRGLAPILAVRSEQGVEGFYTFAIGRHLRLTANAQWVRSFIRDVDDALFLGLRAQLVFRTR